jgi:hypothetical protein
MILYLETSLPEGLTISEYRRTRRPRRRRLAYLRRLLAIYERLS